MFERVSKKVRSKVDPLGWGPAALSVAGRAARNPVDVVRATARFAGSSVRIPLAAAGMLTGREMTAPVTVNEKDRRFADPAWAENPAFFALRQYYEALSQYVGDVLVAGEGDELEDGKARQMADLVLNAAAPTNIVALNPEALVKAFQTGGRSLAKGAGYMASDIVRRGGRPVKVAQDVYTVGENMACTPGKVVFRNDLIEVMQYEPQTDEVYETPLLVTPPWINKYYILDLRPGRSLIEMAVKSGRTVFAISYRNPDRSMASFGMDDYYRLGTATALDVVQEVTGAAKVDILALCLGGAMTAMAAAKDAIDGENRMGTLTLLNTMLDYAEPGELGVMVDSGAIDMIEQRMFSRGYLTEHEMADTFDMLRANDLIFNYWVSRWMKGEAPTAFDILVWNDDSTRMPAKMHSEYLRALYERNDLREKQFVLEGTRLDLAEAKNDCYVVGAINDHIVLWTTSYQAVNLMGGDVRYVLSNGGHLAGAVNPPSKRTWFEAIGKPSANNKKAYPSTPEEFREKADHVETDSWWTDWNTWMSSRAGKKVAPPAMGSEAHPPICDAPGIYVLNEK